MYANVQQNLAFDNTLKTLEARYVVSKYNEFFFYSLRYIRGGPVHRVEPRELDGGRAVL